MASILIIDDTPSIIQALEFYLGTLGHAITTAHGGPAGLLAAQANPPDLVLLDLEMPVMNGVAVCQAMKADPVLGRIPVLIMTGQATQEARNRASTAGAAAILRKPFDLEGLRAEISRHLAEKSAPATT